MALKSHRYESSGGETVGHFSLTVAMGIVILVPLLALSGLALAVRAGNWKAEVL